MELAKSGVQLKTTGKHMAHLEKQILTMLKELDRSRAALEPPEVPSEPRVEVHVNTTNE